MKTINLVILLLLTINYSGRSQTKNFIDQPYIEVRGDADSLVTPDEIYIKIVISEKDTRDRISMEEIESKLMAALTSAGIRIETYLTTRDMLSNYKTYLLKQNDILKSKEYILKVSDAATAGEIFIKLEEAGISNTSIDRVDHSGLENIEAVCRTKAIENAKAKAIALTKPLGQFAGNAIHISDNETSFSNELQGSAAGVVVTGYSTSKNKYEAPKIAFEKIKVSKAVSVKFILK